MLLMMPSERDPVECRRGCKNECRSHGRHGFGAAQNGRSSIDPAPFTKSGETGVDKTTASTSLVRVVRQISTLSHKPCVPNSILKIRHTVVALTFMSMIFVLTRTTKNIHIIIPPF